MFIHNNYVFPHAVRVLVSLVFVVLANLLLIPIILRQADIDGATLARPNDTVLVRNEGFDPYHYSTVEIVKATSLDVHAVQFYLQHCNDLTASELSIERDNYLQIVEEITLISSHYLLVGSNLTYAFTLNGTIDESRTKISVSDSVEDHSRFAQLNSQTLLFSNGSVTFTVTATKPSYYFIDLYTPLPAMPTSINYQVNGTILYYDPASVSSACRINPGDTSCSVSLGNGPVTTKNNPFCILSHIQPLDDDDEDIFLDLTYHVGSERVRNSSDIAILFFLIMFLIISVLVLFIPLCFLCCRRQTRSNYVVASL